MGPEALSPPHGVSGHMSQYISTQAVLHSYPSALREVLAKHLHEKDPTKVTFNPEDTAQCFSPFPSDPVESCVRYAP